MKFSSEFLDEIRARVPLSEVVGARVKLRKEGREWRGLSPFNQERTPSFFVNDQKQFYHDFSSGRSGDIFTFLVDVEGLAFPEAVERLAGMAGLSLPRRTPEGEARDRRRATLHEVLALAAKIYETALHDPVGARARGYLADRRLEPATQREFGLGFAAPERFALRDALAAKGVEGGQMIEAGLLVHGEGIAVPYDRFQNRVMFPIHDRSGRVAAFGGRALDSSARAKYLNSPETELFHKGSLLFNHHRARKAAHDRQQIVVVEGYFDVIAMTQAGFPQTVAPMGTALTADQCALLWSLNAEPILCFDGDNAGRKAAFRAIDLALPLIGAGKSLRFALLPEGQDPDDLARSGGPEAIGEVLRDARPFAEMLFMRETAGQTFETPEKRATLEHRLREAIGRIGDDTLRKHYVADMTRRLDGLFGSVPTRTPAARFRDRQRRVGARKPPEARREIAILAVLIGHPDLLERHWEEIAGLEFASATLAAFRARLVDLPPNVYATSDVLAAALAERGDGGERDRILAAAARMLNWWCLRAEAPSSDAETVLRECLALQRKSGKDCKSPASALAADPTEQNLARLMDIRAAIEGLTEGLDSDSGFRGLLT
jgi:DNA primase